MNRCLPPRVQCLGVALLWLSACAPPAPDGQNPNDGTWHTYQGDATRSQYAALDQIHTGNVAQLQVAWTYDTGDRNLSPQSQIQCNPIIIDTLLFGSTPLLKAFAVHAATGRPVWTFDPFAGTGAAASGVNRGLSYWRDGKDQRILYAAGPTLFALDALTGLPVPGFGDGGQVDLRKGLDRNADSLSVSANTPGAVYQDLLILGTRVHEGPGPSAPGHIRAYDIRTGERAWIFHTIPHPGEFGYETWPPDAWQRVGGANAWAGMSVDHQRGMVFIPTGSPAFDFWGGDRHGENLFGNAILALNAATGARVWHYQVVRHDLWDRDLPAPPNLLTITHNGQAVDVVAQITKSGHVFVLDRDTGTPIFPVEDRPYPASDLIDEAAWPEQRLPLKPAPFARQSFTERDVTDISEAAHAKALARLKTVRSGGQFVPPSTQGTMIFPGFDGGGEWGGAAHDPETGILYVNSNEMPWILQMVDLSSTTGTGERLYATQCATCHGPDRKGDALQTHPSLVGLADRLDRPTVDARITQGKGRMPGFAHLSQEARKALIAFLFAADTPGYTPSTAAGYTLSEDAPYGHTGYNRFLDDEGYPAVKPPWGTLNAINLNTGEFEWTVPLGAFDALTARGLPPTGTENYGGPVVTAGGLLFIGATKDEKFRAFDKKTGQVLFETKLPAGGYATPSTYTVAGRQFVVIAAGGGKMGTPPGATYVAFALPQ